MEIEQLNNLIETIALVTAQHTNDKWMQLIEDALAKAQTNAEQSTEINELAAALSKAQGEFKRPHKSKTLSVQGRTPYHYSTLEDSLDAVIPSLSKHGLCIMQPPYDLDGGQFIIITKLLHGSGQWIQSRVRIIPAKNDVQSLGSQITYMKRYALNAMLGIGGGDIDDDGEAAMTESRREEAKGISINRDTVLNRQVADLVLTKDHLEELEMELEGWPDIAKDILKGFNIRSLADMEDRFFHASAKKIRELKQLRQGRQ